MRAPARKGVHHTIASARRRTRAARERSSARHPRREALFSGRATLDDDGGLWVLRRVMQCYCCSAE